MEKASFQRQILSQINLSHLFGALVQYEENKMNATKVMPYVLATNILEDAADANAKFLMTQLLDKVKIPHEILDTVRLYTELGQNISKATWDYFYSYEFTGKIETSFRADTRNLAPSARPLFLILAEDVIIDIMQAPLNMLLGFIEHICRDWKETSRLRVSTYFLPKHHTELFVYIEGHVANYYGAMNGFDAGVYSNGANIFNGYRHVGLIGDYPFDNKLIGLAKETAIEIAKSTMS